MEACWAKLLYLVSRMDMGYQDDHDKHHDKGLFGNPGINLKVWLDWLLLAAGGSPVYPTQRNSDT